MVNLRIFYGNLIIIYIDFKHLDPDPDLQKNAAPDPGGQNNVDPCRSGSGSTTLPMAKKHSKIYFKRGNIFKVFGP